jgi:hypothetical protein
MLPNEPPEPPELPLPSIEVWPPRTHRPPVPLVQTHETGDVENGVTRRARASRPTNVVRLGAAADHDGGLGG